MTRPLNFINIARVFLDHLDFTVSEIRRQYNDVGITRFALCLSFHPTGTPAMNHARRLIDAFAKIKANVADLPGLDLGVLIQSTLGHGWSGPVPLTDEPWQRIVDDKGNVSSRMCPLDPAFRAYVLDVVDGVMAVGPAFLLLDDDFGIRAGECFCPLHLARFNQETGVERSQAEVAALLAQSPDSPEAAIFWRQRANTAIDFAHEVRAVIDRHDPTCVCTMCTPGGGHGFVNQVTHALSSPSAPPSARINNAIYGLNNPMDLVATGMRTCRVRQVFTDVPDLIDEADTFPHSYYGENAVLFHAHLVTAILNGLTGAKLWMFEFEAPVDTGSQALYEELFRTNRGLYEELHRTVDGIRWLGIQTPLPAGGDLRIHPTLMHKIYTPDFSYNISGFLGFPFAYSTPDKQGLFAIDKQAVDFLSDDELQALFSQNLLIDSEAAKRLDKRGYSALMGVHTGHNPDFFFQNEALEDGTIWGLMWDSATAELVCNSPATQVASWCQLESRTTGKRENISPCMTFFTNERGGRIAVLAWASTAPDYKKGRPQRRLALLKALDFLCSGRFEMAVENGHQALIRHGLLTDGTELVAVVNTALDGLPAVTLRCAAAPQSVLRLLPDGQWQTQAFSCADGILTIPEPLPCTGIIILRLVR